MEKEEIVSLLKKQFHYLFDELNFKLLSIESNKAYWAGKFLSAEVGVYFVYEFREFIPQVQFSLLTTSDISPRPGLYTLIEMYKNSSFKLNSFYLDEIVSYNGFIYQDYFKNAKNITDSLKIINDLIKDFAGDFALGNPLSYIALNDWFKMKVTNLNVITP